MPSEVDASIRLAEFCWPCVDPTEERYFSDDRPELPLEWTVTVGVWANRFGFGGRCEQAFRGQPYEWQAWFMFLCAQDILRAMVS